MKKGQVINSLLDLPEFEPEERTVRLPRLGLELQLRELPYDRLVKLCREREANLQLILAATVNHPELKDPAWYQDRMNCPTPAEALKKVLRKGEVEKICRAIDLLHGYGAGSVMAVEEDSRQAQAIDAAVEELEKN